MLDSTDKLIIEELSQNSRITMKDLGNKIHMTGQATATRVAKLEDHNVIEGYTVKVNQAKLGYPIHAFITILIQNTTDHKYYLAFVNKQEKHVIHNYKISGEGCYLLECRFQTNQSLNLFLENLNQHANYKLSLVIDK